MDIEKRLKKMTTLQLRQVYSKMLKIKNTSLNKKQIILKLLEPLYKKYKMKSYGGITIPEDLLKSNTKPQFTGMLDEHDLKRLVLTNKQYHKIFREKLKKYKELEDIIKQRANLNPVIDFALPQLKRL